MPPHPRCNLFPLIGGLQAAAYRALAQSGARHVVLADHAGSGKTLAYLLPLLQVLREEERVLGAAATQPHCPRLVVVVPTAELCAQVVRVCRALSRAGLRFRSAAATGGRPLRTQKEMLEGGVDVLVGTPGRLAELLGEGCLQLTFCRAVVVDEVDVLLGEDFAFAEQVAPLRAAAPSTTRFVFATATIPEQVYLDLEEVRGPVKLEGFFCAGRQPATCTQQRHLGCHTQVIQCTSANSSYYVCIVGVRAEFQSVCFMCRHFLAWQPHSGLASTALRQVGWWRWLAAAVKAGTSCRNKAVFAPLPCMLYGLGVFQIDPPYPPTYLQASPSSWWTAAAVTKSARRAVSSARRPHCLRCCRSSGPLAPLCFATR